MGDTGDDFRAFRLYMKERKRKHGIDCPGCKVKEPKRIPSRLLPGQRCRVCGYVDSRPHIPRDDTSTTGDDGEEDRKGS